MFSKKDAIFYIIAGNLIGIIAALAGASMPFILFASILIPPVILIAIRFLRLF